jgi:aldose 1-epimerase
LKIPLSSGKKVDVVLGFDNLEDYINSFDLPNAPYFGAIIGQYFRKNKKCLFCT